MNLANTLRELLWENPMTLEATRTLRRTLRTGSNTENPYATRSLNFFLGGTLCFLYLWTLFGIVRASEDISIYLVIAELFLLTLIVPCSLYGAIAVEREKQTYESLILTRLTPAQIVCGKLWWRVGLIGCVMAVFVPLIVVSYLSGRDYTPNLTASQLVWGQVQIFAWSVFLGAFSLWVSAKSKKGITALLGIVATVIAFLVMVPLLLSLFGGLSAPVDQSDPLAYRDLYIYGYDRSYSDMPSHWVEFMRRGVALTLGANLLFALNPFVMVANLPNSYNSAQTAYDLWCALGVHYWGVAVFALSTAAFVRAAVKTLRGLEMPVAEKVRKSRAAFGVGKAGA